MRRRIVTLAIAAAVLAISLFGLPLAIGVAKYNIGFGRPDLSFGWLRSTRAHTNCGCMTAWSG